MHKSRPNSLYFGIQKAKNGDRGAIVFTATLRLTGKPPRYNVSVISRIGDFCVLIFYIGICRYSSSLSVYSTLRRIQAAVSHTISCTCCILY